MQSKGGGPQIKKMYPKGIKEFGGGGKYVNGIQVSFPVFILDVFLMSETQAVPYLISPCQSLISN